MRRYEIAVVPGDGIGKEVVPEGLRVLEAAAAAGGFELGFRPFRLELRDVQGDRGDDARGRARPAARS